MIPYLRTELGLVYIEVLCFEASCFASDTAKVGKIWLIISSFLIVGLISSSGGIWDNIVNGQWAYVTVSDVFLGGNKSRV